MERYTMFLDWKNQHCENDSTTQSNLQIECNPYQTTTGIFHRTRTENFTICIIEFWKLVLASGFKSFIRYMICKYLLPLCGCVIQWAEFFILMN